jgi:hypothetical protein
MGLHLDDACSTSTPECAVNGYAPALGSGLELNKAHDVVSLQNEVVAPSVDFSPHDGYLVPLHPGLLQKLRQEEVLKELFADP